MFLAYAAGYAEADENEILLIDSPAMELDLPQTLEKALKFQPELAILGVSTPSINNDLMVSKAIKEKTGCKIALMGTHATALPKEVMDSESAVDFIIRGEAEYTVRELIRNLRGDDPANIKDVKGLTWRDNQEIILNPERPKIHELDDIPWVSKTYHKHLYSCYKHYFYGANLNPLVVILSGRGCPFKCIFCALPQTITGHTYRTRSVADVVDEMEWIYDNYEEVGEIFFEDDTFTAKPKRTMELCDEIIRRQRKMVWSANARADVKIGLLKKMKEAGCRELCVGFESASPDVLKNVRKGVTGENAMQFMRDCNSAGIIVHGCFMVGNPGDTQNTLQKTLDLAKKLNPNTAQFYPIMAYPGTKAFENARKNGELASLNYDHWLDKDGYHNTTVICKDLSSKDLVDFCDRARREFYLRPHYLIKAVMMAITNPKERYRIFRGGWTLLKHLFRQHGDVKTN